MKDPKALATKKQIEMLHGLSIPVPIGLTRLEASHLIRENKRSRI